MHKIEDFVAAIANIPRGHLASVTTALENAQSGKSRFAHLAGADLRSWQAKTRAKAIVEQARADGIIH